MREARSWSARRIPFYETEAWKQAVALTPEQARYDLGRFLLELVRWAEEEDAQAEANGGVAPAGKPER